ncbi:MAG: DUF1302 domain-containing protein [Desulfobacterales bacterium]|nr:DUF1302 domain-containing protein [Desulfobacterales bacterium]
MCRCSRPVTLKKAFSALALAALLAFFQAMACAEISEGTEDLLTGFEEEEALEVPRASSSAPSFFDRFSGYAKILSVVNTTHNRSGAGGRDWQGLSSLRLEGQIEADFRMAAFKTFVSLKGFYDLSYGINGRSNFSDSVLEEYEKELELQEAYIQGSLSGNIDLKLGRQVVVWGRSDNFRVTDVLNPLDNRQPGLVDIENLRLPLSMTKLDLFFGDWNLDLIAVHEHRYDKSPPTGHFFNPLPGPLPHEELPSHNLENTEFGVELNGTFSGWDLSFYGARFFNDQARFVKGTPQKLTHDRLYMIGTSFSAARVNLLYIAELAHLRGLHFINDEKAYNRSDFLIGIEYSGVTDTTISLDYVTRYLHDYKDVLDATPENPVRTDNAIACRITRTFCQEVLELEIFIQLNGESGQRGAMQRFTAQYDLTDNWLIKGGGLLYQPGNGPLSETGNINQLFFELRLDF